RPRPRRSPWQDCRLPLVAVAHRLLRPCDDEVDVVGPGPMLDLAEQPAQGEDAGRLGGEVLEKDVRRQGLVLLVAAPVVGAGVAEVVPGSEEAPGRSPAPRFPVSWARRPRSAPGCCHRGMV